MHMLLETSNSLEEELETVVLIMTATLCSTNYEPEMYFNRILTISGLKRGKSFYFCVRVLLYHWKGSMMVTDLTVKEFFFF